MQITWQKQFARKWLASAEQGRCPHAVLLAGPPGVGKRAAAAWMVAHKLGVDSDATLPVFPFKRPLHADLHWLLPPDGKESILIDQIRALVNDLCLTSYSGHGKAAVIEPANAMTTNAANSLLKTLEEPPGDVLLILIADRTGRIPATIFSRCQRFDFRAPDESEALGWLDRLRPGGTWIDAVRAAGNAPLAALEVAGHLQTGSTMARDLAALTSGAASPVELAASWAKIETKFVLEWLARQVQSALKTQLAGKKTAPSAAISESVLQHMDRRNLFCYLDIINRLRGQPGGSFNVQLTLEGLLIDWANGLEGLRHEGGHDSLLLVQARGGKQG